MKANSADILRFVSLLNVVSAYTGFGISALEQASLEIREFWYRSKRLVTELEHMRQRVTSLIYIKSWFLYCDA